MKKCTKCGESKPREAFGLNKGTHDGLHCHCRACRRRNPTFRALSKEEQKAVLRENGGSHDLALLEFMRVEKAKQGCLQCGFSGHWAIDFYNRSFLRSEGLRKIRSTSVAVASIATQLHIPLCRNCKAGVEKGEIPATIFGKRKLTTPSATTSI